MHLNKLLGSGMGGGVFLNKKAVLINVQHRARYYVIVTGEDDITMILV